MYVEIPNDRALTILPILLVAQMLLANTQFDFDQPPLRELSNLASAMWALSVDAATVDLRSIQTATCAATAQALAGQCRVWPHGVGSWGSGIAAMVALMLAGAIGAWYRLRHA